MAIIESVGIEVNHEVCLGNQFISIDLASCQKEVGILCAEVLKNR